MAAGVALVAGIGVSWRLDSSPPRDQMREAGDFLGPLGEYGLVAHTDSTAEARRSLEPIRAREAVRVPDSKLRLDFGMKLEDSSLPDDAIRYDVRDQVIHLDGTVSSPSMRDRFELLARSVRGVKGVENAIRLTSIQE